MTIPKLKFGQNILLAIGFSIIQVLIIHFAPIIYISLLFIILFSLVYGLLEPQRGWILALIQIVLVILGYWILRFSGFVAVKPDEAIFVTHVSFFPSLAASFLTSFLFKSTKD
ncbi:hypothetical protein [Lacihabitans soyangensis]|uniref:Uncharacterized protein n=1 Tax=Lacihabitans soyangensis TaxID=869394 RepID=A0AAE3H3Z2_9BACT|nr:hypothetical protein [Lacihabitans soyangensis]MCP9764704.1 hypothetical protein [Lacihabitans soyangensis]